LAEDKVDEFTKAKVRRTSYEKLDRGSHFIVSYRFNDIDGTKAMNLKLAMGPTDKVYGIPDGSKLMLKLANDSVVILENIEAKISCSGCGSNGIFDGVGPGTETLYPLSNKHIEMLKASPITKIRIYKTDGYLEDTINAGKASLFISCLNIIYN